MSRQTDADIGHVTEKTQEAFVPTRGALFEAGQSVDLWSPMMIAQQSARVQLQLRRVDYLERGKQYDFVIMQVCKTGETIMKSRHTIPEIAAQDFASLAVQELRRQSDA